MKNNTILKKGLSMQNLEKLSQLVLYLLSKEESHSMNSLKLMKMLYLSDRESLKETCYSISGDTFVSLKNGPALQTVRELINGSKLDDKWTALFIKENDLLKINTNDNLRFGKLSKFEMNIIDKVFDDFKDYTTEELIDYTHSSKNIPEWHYDNNETIINEDDILSLLDFDKETIAYYREEKTILGS